MPLIPDNDPRPASYQKDKAEIWREIRALWKLNHPSSVTITSSGGGTSGATLSDTAPPQVKYTASDTGTSEQAARGDHTHRSVQFAYDYVVVT